MLPQSFPDKYIETVNGKEVSIPFHTDFRQWMRFEELITDSRVNRDVLSITALRMIFPERLPSDLMRGALFMLVLPLRGKAARRKIFGQFSAYGQPQVIQL